MPEDINPQDGVSRRSVLKRGAIAGGAIMWATPMVQSFTSAAGAQGRGTPLCDCRVCVEIELRPGQFFHSNCMLTDDSCNCGCCCVSGGDAFCDACGARNECDVPPEIDPGTCSSFQPGRCPA